jgi:putative addiction module CopG family antidote
MTEITIPLPQALLDYAQEQVDAGTYADVGDFVRDLLRRDQASRDRLWAAIDEGDASGSSERGFEEIIDAARERARSRAA